LRQIDADDDGHNISNLELQLHSHLDRHDNSNVHWYVFSNIDRNNFPNIIGYKLNDHFRDHGHYGALRKPAHVPVAGR